MGFALAGVCAARPSDLAAQLHEWLALGRHASMDWLPQTAQTRLDVGRFLPGARSVIVVADQYAGRGDASGVDPVAARQPAPTGRIARYALGRDYHRAIARRLHRLADRLRREHPGAAFRSFVDSAPVLEREHARRAGLGWIGKHTLLIHPSLGSYLLLGGIATTLELTPGDRQAPLSPPPVADHCGSCTRCIDACPTRAISPYSVDASRCISYLTIEHDAPIDPALHAPIDDWLLGCDICQEVCPFNQPVSAAPAHSGQARSEGDPARPWPRVNPAYTSPSTRISARWDLFDMLDWSPEDRAVRLSSSAVKRATLEVLKRNALIVLGNLACEQPRSALAAEILARARTIAADPTEPELLRITAAQVLARLPSP